MDFDKIIKVPFEKVDRKLLIDLFNNPLVKRHMPLSPGVFTLDDYYKFLEDKQVIWNRQGFGPSAYYINGEFIGWGGIQPDGDEFEVALVLDPNRWGCGKLLYKDIMREAFSDHHLESINILLPSSRKKYKWLPKEGFIEAGTVIIDNHKFTRYRAENLDNSIAIKFCNDKLNIDHYG
jgi:hypothetical protein